MGDDTASTLTGETTDPLIALGATRSDDSRPRRRVGCGRGFTGRSGDRVPWVRFRSVSAPAAACKKSGESGFDSFGERNDFVIRDIGGSDEFKQGMCTRVWCRKVGMDHSEEGFQVKGHASGKVGLERVDSSDGSVVVGDGGRGRFIFRTRMDVKVLVVTVDGNVVRVAVESIVVIREPFSVTIGINIRLG